MRAAALAAALLVTSVLTLAGCDDGKEDDVDPAKATARLEQQRDDVRAATAELQQVAAETLGGVVANSSGQFRGCESGGIEEFKNFQYRAEARIDAGAAGARPYLDQLQPALEASGFEGVQPGERPGGTTLRAEREGVTASFSELPDQGDYVLLAVAGPCVDVPEDDRSAWLTREEPTPEIR